MLSLWVFFHANNVCVGKFGTVCFGRQARQILYTRNLHGSFWYHRCILFYFHCIFLFLLIYSMYAVRSMYVYVLIFDDWTPTIENVSWMTKRIQPRSLAAIKESRRSNEYVRPKIQHSEQCLNVVRADLGMSVENPEWIQIRPFWITRRMPSYEGEKLYLII